MTYVETSGGADWPRPTACPVCRGVYLAPLADIDARRYWRCVTCEARFLDPAHRLSKGDEHRHYLVHKNDPDDPRYRRFMSKLVEPLLARVPARASGLDYGAGPGPVAAAMMREAGHNVRLYDPFFNPDQDALNGAYDFIIVSEAAEHFHNPADEFDVLAKMLHPGGWLGVMTSFLIDDEGFAAWRYRMDPTHVVFYRAETFGHIAAARGLVCEIPVKDVALLRKPSP
ncbi:MAG: class I SAM-dependent methyltransferase [Terricaulis sp.]